MAGPLLETKLHVPRGRRGLVARPRLIERLSRGAESALTLVSAPAGFGKTTLLTEWLADTPADGRSAAWLSLDQPDNDPARFWKYLIAALETAAPAVGAGALSLLRSPQEPIEAVLATLLNDLSALSNDVVLVLDDYHVIDARDVQDGMAFLLEHLPPQMHLVIAGRADPALPLSRLRGRGELVEIRAADLRFTPDEAAAYLNEVMGLVLTAQDVAALEGRTEGWIAALQLAALSLQGRDDAAGFIAGFAGDDRYIVDYLVEEVLQRQPENVRSFLLKTSILSRLSGSLCDAVTGQDGGKAMLEALDRGNLFLVQLDDRRRWYRYQHLFGDVLRAHLEDEQPDRVRELHLRASDWYERNGERSEAIRHALAAEDFERAADLVELALPALRRGRQYATLRLWLEALPEELIRVRPVLSVGYAGALMVRGEVEGVEARLLDAERWLDTSTGQGIRDGHMSPTSPMSPTEMVVVDEKEFRGLPSAIAMYRAGQALVLGDVAGTMTHARRALDLVGEDDHLGRGSPAALLGLACWTIGDLDAAQRWYADAIASLEKAGHLSDVIGCSIAVADIRVVQGRLREAMSTYERGLQHATDQAAPPLRGTADMHVGMSQLLRERNDLEAAVQHLLTGRELGEHAGLPQNRYRWRVAMARIREAEGDLDGALDLLNEAERVYDGDFSPNVRPVPALRARVLVALGRMGEALGWARERGLSVDDDLSYLREFEHITLAKVLLAHHTTEPAERSLHEAAGLLERLLQAAEDGGRTGSVIEIMVLQALANQTQGDIPAALASLQRALTLSEPEGYVRVFVDEGPPMAALLRAVTRAAHGEQQGIARDYARRLVAAVDKTEDSTPVRQGLAEDRQRLAEDRQRLAEDRQGLVEPLSKRELEVLRLLGTDLDGPDIARELVVSLNTVRTHTKNIYAKLGVNNRRAAVRRADQLDLLSRTRDR
jgi:LuxR family maltose regulon positive regulatory protein